MPRIVGAGSGTARFQSQVIVYACDSSYWEHVYVSLYSLVVNNPDLSLDVRVASDAPDPRFFEYVRDLERRHGDLHVTWLPVKDDRFRDTPTGGVASRAIYYRLLLGSLIPRDYQRVLFLDGDTIIRGTICPLLETPLAESVLAATPQHSYRPAPLPPIDYAARIGLPPGSDYFNAGVMLIDLDNWRTSGVEEQCLDYVQENLTVPDRLDYGDQDALNAVLAGKWKVLKPAFNFSEWTVEPDAFVRNGTHYANVDNGALIAHYAGGRKPWHGGSRHPYEGEYWRYRMKTPYANSLKFVRSHATRLASKPFRFILERSSRSV